MNFFIVFLLIVVIAGVSKNQASIASIKVKIDELDAELSKLILNQATINDSQLKINATLKDHLEVQRKVNEGLTFLLVRKKRSKTDGKEA